MRGLAEPSNAVEYVLLFAARPARDDVGCTGTAGVRRRCKVAAEQVCKEAGKEEKAGRGRQQPQAGSGGYSSAMLCPTGRW